MQEEKKVAFLRTLVLLSLVHAWIHLVGRQAISLGLLSLPALCEHTRTSPRYLYFCCCQSKKPAALGSCRALSHACALPKNRTECAWSDFELDTYSRSLFDSLLFWVYQISAVCCESINQTVDVRSKKKKKEEQKAFDLSRERGTAGVVDRAKKHLNWIGRRYFSLFCSLADVILMRTWELVSYSHKPLWGLAAHFTSLKYMYLQSPWKHFSRRLG